MRDRKKPPMTGRLDGRCAMGRPRERRVILGTAFALAPLLFSMAVGCKSDEDQGRAEPEGVQKLAATPVSDQGAGTSSAAPTTGAGNPDAAVGPGTGTGSNQAVWVVMKAKAATTQAAATKDWKTRGSNVYNALVSTASTSQSALHALLVQKNVKHRPFWIVNAIKVEADQATIDEIAQRSDVAEVVKDKAYSIPPLQPGQKTPIVKAVEWGVTNIRAPEVWSTFGVKGDGIVVANIDTGVQFDHPALSRQYRGTQADGSYDHNYNWYDPASVCGMPSTAPCDNVGHGTHTMGTMVGDDGDPGTNQIGVAPHARWIAAKGCEYDSCTLESLMAAGQWVLAPTDLNGQNPRPDLRPHIVNNSWGGMGGDTFYQAVVQSWVDAGMFPAFAAGNSGPSCGSTGSPGDYPESYAAGAYDESDTIADFSSRGPSAFNIIKPNVAAPGVNVRSSVPGNGYDWYSGTSMATPHLSGTVALLWSASIALVGDVATTRTFLDQAAVDTNDTSCGGDSGNNNVWGQGRLDAYAAVDLAPKGPTGTLQGTVTKAADGTPLVGATLLIQGGAKDRTVGVGPDGTYKARLAVGVYTVTAKAFGFIDQAAANVTIADSTVTTQNFALTLAPSFALSGIVKTAAGSPVAGAQVTVVGTPLPPVTTNASGQYSFAAIPAGTYQISAQGSACYAVQTLPLTLSANATLNFALSQRTDSYGYSCVPTTYAYIQADTVLPINDYSYQADVTLPFPFTLYGQTYETATVAAEGYLTFQKSAYNYYYNTPIPDPGDPNATLYAFWDDLYPDPSSSVRSQTLGTAPNRQFVIEWRDLVSADTNLRANFEVVMFENGKIQMQYVSGTDPWQQGLMATLGIENETGTDAFQYSYNQASVAPQTAVLYNLPPSGIVQGNVTNANDSSAIGGATIQALQGTTVVRSTKATSSGFYRLILPAGSYKIVATETNYADAQATVSVALNQTLQQNFALKTGLATLTPATLQLVMPIGQTRTRTLVLKNTGSAKFDFTLAESGGKKLAVAPTRLLPRTMGFKPNAMTTKGLFATGPTPLIITPDAPGDVLKSFAPQGLQVPWAVAFTGDLWVGDPMMLLNKEFTTDGAATGRQWNQSWASEWAGDMAYDSARNIVCQVNVGGDNGIYCWNPDTGTVTDKITGSFPWTQISQRGLAYRSDDDSFYIGGWNNGTIYHVKGLAATDKGTVISSCQPADGAISGLAYNSAAQVLWVATNSMTDTIYELNPDDCTVLSTLPNPAPGFNGAGMEMDADGNLWIAEQASNQVALIDSGVPAFNDVPWLTPTPTSGSVAKGGSTNIQVKVDTTGLAAGVYLAALYVQTTAAKQTTIRIPVSLVVSAYQQAVVAGGKAYTDTSGDPWAADRAYSAGQWGYVLKSKTDSTTKTIAGTTDPTLFKTQRIAPYGYRFDNVPNGIYEIDLNFAELNNIKIGKRLFDVIIENTLVLPALDIAYEVGVLKADKHTFFVEVTDGEMDVRLIARAGYDDPLINSLRVTHRPDR